MTPRKSVSSEVLSEISRLADLGLTAAEIERSLKRSFPLNVPPTRTLQRVVSKLRPDPSGPWTLGTFPAEDEALVLPVLAEVVARSRGRVAGLTRSEGDWTIRIRRAAPFLESRLERWVIYRLARVLARRQAREAPTEDLAILLAFLVTRDFDRWRELPKTIPRPDAREEGILLGIMEVLGWEEDDEVRENWVAAWDVGSQDAAALSPDAPVRS